MKTIQLSIGEAYIVYENIYNKIYLHNPKDADTLLAVFHSETDYLRITNYVGTASELSLLFQFISDNRKP